MSESESDSEIRDLPTHDLTLTPPQQTSEKHVDAEEEIRLLQDDLYPGLIEGMKQSILLNKQWWKSSAYDTILGKLW